MDKILKHLESNRIIFLCHWKKWTFLNRTQKMLTTKEKIDKLDSIKIRDFYHQR